jgi:hypothetical protein
MTEDIVARLRKADVAELLAALHDWHEPRAMIAAQEQKE